MTARPSLGVFASEGRMGVAILCASAARADVTKRVQSWHNTDQPIGFGLAGLVPFSCGRGPLPTSTVNARM